MIANILVALLIIFACITAWIESNSPEWQRHLKHCLQGEYIGERGRVVDTRWECGELWK